MINKHIRIFMAIFFCSTILSTNEKSNPLILLYYYFLNFEFISGLPYL